MLSDQQLKKLQVWGKVRVSNPENIEIDAGSRFDGERFVGRVTFVNDTEYAVKLEPIRNEVLMEQENE